MSEKIICQICKKEVSEEDETEMTINAKNPLGEIVGTKTIIGHEQCIWDTLKPKKEQGDK